MVRGEVHDVSDVMLDIRLGNSMGGPFATDRGALVVVNGNLGIGGAWLEEWELELGGLGNAEPIGLSSTRKAEVRHFSLLANFFCGCRMNLSFFSTFKEFIYPSVKLRFAVEARLLRISCNSASSSSVTSIIFRCSTYEGFSPSALFEPGIEQFISEFNPDLASVSNLEWSRVTEDTFCSGEVPFETW